MIDFIANTIPSPPDQRDYPYVPASRPPYPDADLRPYVAEVENQGPYPTCVANGSLSACEWLAKRHGDYVDLSRAFTYYMGRQISKLPDNVQGMIPRDALKSLYRHGVPLESEWAYTSENMSKAPPESVMQSAFTRRVNRFECVHHSYQGSPERQVKIDRINAALAEGLPVGIAMVVTRSLTQLSGPWQTHRYELCNATNTIGGHYMTIVASRQEFGMWCALNSWDKSGDGGYVGLPFSIVDEPFFEAWVIRDYNGYTVPEPPGIKLELRNQFVINARIVPPPELINQHVNLWIGAKLPDGRVFLKHPGKDVWKPMKWPEFPICDSLILDEDNPIRVVEWMNLEQFPGADIYVAYGDSPIDWHMEKLCTL